MRRLAAALVVALPLMAVPLFAQRYDDAITVNVVDVPVYVERFGKPVTGLTREDFELFVDGKPHPIEYFDVIDERSAAAAAAPDAPLDLKLRRLIVLVFDLGSSTYSLQRSRDAAMQTVAASAPGDVFAVATAGRSGVRFVTAFTTDHVALQRAIATLAASALRDPFRVAMLDEERTTWSENIRGAEAGSGSFEDIWSDRLAPLSLGDSSASANAAQFETTAKELEALESDEVDLAFVDALAQLAERLAPLEGVKQVVLLSERRAETEPNGAVLQNGTLLQHTTRLHARYRAAGVTLNGVDIRPLDVPGGGEISTQPDGRDRMPNALTSEFLNTLALETGGAVATKLPHLLERNRHAYVLGFRPPEGASSRSIRVRVKNLPALTNVRYRRSYDLDAVKNADKGLVLADTLMNDIPQNGVTLNLAVKGTEVMASIPGAELLSYAPDAPLGLEVFFYVFNEEGLPFSWNVLQLAVDLEKGHDFLSKRPYSMRQELVLQPGRYTVKVLVRIAGTDRVGFARAEVVVPPV